MDCGSAQPERSRAGGVNAVLLCPGPSLFDVRIGELDRKTIIAVNRAAIISRVGADWWAVSDWPMARDNRHVLVGRPQWFAPRDIMSRLGINGVAMEDLQYPTACAYTACRALVLAHRLGAERIDVYGADWTDEPDADGVTFTGNNRDARRWKVERETWDAVSLWLQGQGVTVNRVVRNGDL